MGTSKIRLLFAALLQHYHLYTQNLFAPQAQDLFEKLAECLLDNFHREHILLNLKIKKLLRKIRSKNLTARVFLVFLVRL